MTSLSIADIERDIGNHELILNIIQEFYMESRQKQFREPTVKQIFKMVSYIHARIEKKQCELKILKNEQATRRLS